MSYWISKIEQKVSFYKIDLQYDLSTYNNNTNTMYAL